VRDIVGVADGLAGHHDVDWGALQLSAAPPPRTPTSAAPPAPRPRLCRAD